MSRVPWRAVARAAEVTPRRIALSILTGTAALGSAIGLAAVAAWLIARAAGMPSPADLALAATIVRAFGIGRGLFRYLERLVSHSTALQGTVALRARAYDAVARSGARHALSLRRGDVVARMGADIDALGDLVVRSVVPVGVAVSVSAISTGISLWLLPSAGLVLAAALLVAGLGAAALSWRASRIAADAGSAAQALVSTSAMTAMESGTEHRVWGTRTAASEDLVAADRALERAIDAAARPRSLSTALQIACQGVAMLAGLAWGVQAASQGHISPMDAAVLALLPLAAFEAVNAVPGAVEQLFTSRAAALRVAEMVGDLEALANADDGRERPESPSAEAHQAATEIPCPTLRLEGVSVAWPGMTPTVPVTATLKPGAALGIVGRSGIGKSTLLLAIAGAVTPKEGRVLLDDREVTGEDGGAVVALTPEDAHLFGTTLLENLRAARGDITEDEALSALDAVGLTPWLASLPDGLNTLIGSGGGTVSGGERRRILLARVLLSPAPIHLIDEPAEHLDADGVDALRAVVRRMRERGHTVVIVTHDRAVLDVVDEVVTLDE